MGIPFVPSVANFVLVRVGDGRAVFHALLKRKIIVRALKGYDLPEWVRISIGTMDQNRRCVAALREVLTAGSVTNAAGSAGYHCRDLDSAGEGAIALIRVSGRRRD